MMLNKRLINTVSESKRYVTGNVAAQWLSLTANIALMTVIANALAVLELHLTDLLIAVSALLIRFACSLWSAQMSYLSSKTVKTTLREQIYQKMLRLGASYSEQVQTSEVVQVAVEGVEQLETYFGSYLPQFFYAMLAPLTLFFVLARIDLPTALVLLICVPLIPITIAAVQTWAKKLLGQYWGEYTSLGDTFLENLQGLTTLKIYQSDDFKQTEMNEQAERFRVITMKVLSMQLNSITVMDLIAYGGAALGIILSVSRCQAGHVSFAGCLLIILLSADFFIPMRQLGSFFHIAMNGMAAADKIFHLLDFPETVQTDKQICPKDTSISCKDLHFSYQKEQEILHGIDLTFPIGSFTALVGESGCGKSTIAGILMGRNKGYSGSVTIGGIELSQIQENSLMKMITYVGHQNYLFKGSVRDNLLYGNPNASDEMLWSVLQRVNLSDFLSQEQGLETLLSEKASNLSGGQCQRLSLARALLHDSPIYIFDEATSNIDAESEHDIMQEISELAKEKTVILISHRLANVVNTDQIYVLEHGHAVESGTHDTLLTHNGTYSRLWIAQQTLEAFTKGTSL